MKRAICLSIAGVGAGVVTATLGADLPESHQWAAMLGLLAMFFAHEIDKH